MSDASWWYLLPPGWQRYIKPAITPLFRCNLVQVFDVRDDLAYKEYRFERQWSPSYIEQHNELRVYSVAKPAGVLR